LRKREGKKVRRAHAVHPEERKRKEKREGTLTSRRVGGKKASGKGEKKKERDVDSGQRHPYVCGERGKHETPFVQSFSPERRKRKGRKKGGRKEAER